MSSAKIWVLSGPRGVCAIGSYDDVYHDSEQMDLLERYGQRRNADWPDADPHEAIWSMRASIHRVDEYRLTCHAVDLTYCDVVE